jgi:hypothetical protein
MSYSRTELTNEINGIIGERLDENQPIAVGWIVQLVLKKHWEILPLSDFSTFARHEIVNDEVARCVRRFKDPRPDEMAQLVLPGFKHLQKAYRIARNSESMIVPVTAMTDDELLAKVQEHRAMASGHNEHADEIVRYVQQRQEARAAS